MSQRLVYLAGPISGLEFGEASQWRDVVTDELFPHIHCLSPLRQKQYLAARGPLESLGYSEHPLSTPQGITARDRFDCQRADVVLFNFAGAERISVGTCIEIGWADAARRPMVAIMEPGNVHDHAIVRGAVPFIVPTLVEAVALVRAILLP